MQILSLGGSLATGNVEDHYFTPYDLGYGFMIRFDHDFVGRTSLEAMSPESRKKKVRLVWNDEDVVDIYASGLSKGERYKHLDMPATSYATAANGSSHARWKDRWRLLLSGLLGV